MEGIELLSQAADALAELDPTTLTDDELGSVLVDWHRLEGRLAASKARLTAAFDRRGAYRADGSRSAAVWLARKTNGSAQALRAQTRLARRLRHMPTTTAALASGDISERHAEVLAAVAGSARKVVADAFPGAEEQLVGYAKDLDFGGFAAAVRYWESVVDEDGVEDQATADHASRHVHLSETFRGNWALDGRLDPIAGTELSTALQHIYDELFTTDWADAKEIHGDNTSTDLLARTPGQRRADALVEMARRATAAPPDAKPPVPLIVIHLGDDTLRRLCELASGRVIAPGLLVPRLGEADIQRIIYTGRSRTITELGERSRFFTGPLREAIQLRDRRCVEPGCDTPAHHCDIDHDLPHTLGGLTNQTNGRTRCNTHNRHKADTHPDNYYDTGPPPSDADPPPDIK